jgi:hypothetical protein
VNVVRFPASLILSRTPFWLIEVKDAPDGKLILQTYAHSGVITREELADGLEKMAKELRAT